MTYGTPGGCYGKVRQPIQQEIIHTGTMECTLCPIDGQQPYPTIHAKGSGGNCE